MTTPCPSCGLMLEPFQTECPRCARQTAGFNPPPVGTPCPQCGLPLPSRGRKRCLYCGYGQPGGRHPGDISGDYPMPTGPLPQTRWIVGLTVAVIIAGTAFLLVLLGQRP